VLKLAEDRRSRPKGSSLSEGCRGEVHVKETAITSAARARSSAAGSVWWSVSSRAAPRGTAVGGRRCRNGEVRQHRSRAASQGRWTRLPTVWRCDRGLRLGRRDAVGRHSRTCRQDISRPNRRRSREAAQGRLAQARLGWGLRRSHEIDSPKGGFRFSRQSAKLRPRTFCRFVVYR